MIKQVKADLYRYVPSPYSIKCLLKGSRSQGFRYSFFLRLYNRYKSAHFWGILFKFILRHYSYKYGFQIGGEIGPGFYIGHFGTVIVSVNSSIGSNCNISPGVTIGATRRGEKKGAPKIGNLVWIGTNAIIVGNITVGNNVLIAPGAYVNFNVPDNSIVLGNPGKIIPSPDATVGYINNIYVEES